MVQMSTDETQKVDKERMMKETMEKREQKWLEKEKAYQEREKQLMSKLQKLEEAFQQREKQMLTQDHIYKTLLLRYNEEIEKTLANLDKVEEEYKEKVDNTESTQLIHAQGEKITAAEPGLQSEPVKVQEEARGGFEIENKRPEAEMVLLETESANKKKRRSRNQRRRHKHSEASTKVSEEEQSEHTVHFTEARDKATEGESETTVEDCESTQSLKDVQSDTETFTTSLECKGMESQGQLSETQMESTVDQLDCEMEVFVAGEPPVDPHNGSADSPVTVMDPEIIESLQAETTLSGEAQSEAAQADTEPLEAEIVPIKDEIVQDFTSTSQDKRKKRRRRKNHQVTEIVKATTVSKATPSEATVLLTVNQDKTTEGESESTVEDCESTKSLKDVQSDTETFTTSLECKGMESQGQLSETQMESTVDQVDCEMEVFVAGESPVDPHNGSADSLVTALEPEIIESLQAETTLSGEAQSGAAQADMKMKNETVPFSTQMKTVKHQKVHVLKYTSQSKRKGKDEEIINNWTFWKVKMHRMKKRLVEPTINVVPYIQRDSETGDLTTPFEEAVSDKQMQSLVPQSDATEAQGKSKKEANVSQHDHKLKKRRKGRKKH